MYAYFCIGFIDFMLVGKKLIDFTSMFSPYDFKKNDNIILSYFKDDKINKTNLSEQKKFRLFEIIGITFIKGLIKGNYRVKN